MNTQGLTDNQFESGLTSLPEYQQLLQLFGGNEIAMQNTLFSPGTFDPNVNTGFDQTGINTFQDTEGDPEKYKAFNLLNDPNADIWTDEYFDALEEIGYSFPSFDENWYGGFGWDDYLDQPYYSDSSLALSDPKFWKQTSLSELDPTGFADREMIYGEELGNQMATPGAWLVQPFGSEVVEGV